MRATTIRWVFYMGALLAIGPLAGLLTASIRGVDGGVDATGLVSNAPAGGLAKELAAILIAGVFGAACAATSGIRPGMITAGLVLCWATWRTGTVDQLLRTAGNASPLASMAIEGGILALAGAAVAIALCGMAKPEPPAAGGAAPALGLGERLHAAVRGLIDHKAAWLALAGAAVACAAVAWLMAIEPLKGQAVAAAAAGAAMAAVAAKLVHSKVSPALVVVGVAALMVLGPLTPTVMGQVSTPTKMLDTLYRNGLFTLAHITPLDWVAGAFLGIPWGLGWVGTTEKQIAAPK